MNTTDSVPQTSSLLRDYGMTVLAAVLVALLIRNFMLEAYRIPTATMRPTLEAGDTIFVAKWPYGLHLPFWDRPFIKGRKPHYGEVVIYARLDDPGRESVKRVAGLPGDQIQIKEGRLSINGKDVSHANQPTDACGEETLPSGSHPVCWDPPHPRNYSTVIPEGHVFVIGDERTEQPDPKLNPVWNVVPFSALRGEALWVWLSIEPNRGSPFSRIRFERMLRRIH